MFDFLKKIYQQRQLRHAMQTSHEKRIENWDNIKTIGLIFVVGDSYKWNLLNRFITAQNKHNKKIFLLGLHPKDYQIDYIFTHTETIICHEKDDFSFLGMPKSDIVDLFTKRHYDLLVDATEQPCFFGKLITAITDAYLKVGYTNNEADDEGPMEMYDMTIQGNDTIDFKDYIEQIVKYLTMVKK